MVCKYCGDDLPENRFQIANTVKGVVYRRKKCTSCKQKDQNKRGKANLAIVQQYKAEKGCYVCGMKDHRALQLHHSDPSTKDGNVSDMIVRKFGINVIMTEVAKCNVICANCHQILHYEERSGISV